MSNYFEHIERRWSESQFEDLYGDLDYNADLLHEAAIEGRSEVEQDKADTIVQAFRKTLAQLREWKERQP